MYSNYDTWGIILTLSSLTASVTNYHQIFVLFKSKKSDQISILHLCFTFTNLMVHLIYSYQLKNTNLIIATLHSCFAVLLCCIVSSFYRLKPYTIQSRLLKIDPEYCLYCNDKKIPILKMNI